MKARSLPLGIDVGASRIRVARARAERDGAMRIEALASRDVYDRSPALLGALVDELVREVGGRERRCVAAIGGPDVVLRVLTLPKMTWAERKSAVRFEVQRFVSWDIDSVATQIRVQPLDRTSETYVVGVVRDAYLAERLAGLRCAGLRVLAVDNEAYALRRAHPQVDAVVDIGRERSTIHIYEHAPTSLHIGHGGDHVTLGIATDLAIDEASAEKRKRIVGLAGAGAAARDRLVRAIAEGIERARTRSRVSRIALVGNGGRLPGLAAALESASGVVVDTSVTQLLEGAYADDVLRSAAPDWTMAAALASWSIAL